MNFKPKNASIVYYVSDITRTEAFYNETFGLELKRMEGADPFWLQGNLEGGLVKFYSSNRTAFVAPPLPLSSRFRMAVLTTSLPILPLKG